MKTRKRAPPGKAGALAKKRRGKPARGALVYDYKDGEEIVSALSAKARKSSK